MPPKNLNKRKSAKVVKGKFNKIIILFLKSQITQVNIKLTCVTFCENSFFSLKTLYIFTLNYKSVYLLAE